MSLAKTIAATAVAMTIAGAASAAFAGAALTTATTKLYDGPVDGAAIVATVAPGARLGVLWCGMHGQWCLVTYHARQGFASPAGLTRIGGQLAVGSSGGAAGAGDNGADGSSPASGASSPHLATGAGSLTLGPSAPGGSKPALSLSATIRPH